MILFERVAWCVGQSGLYLVLGLITISYLVVTLTTLSIAAISSNGKMKGGGAYFMISRPSSLCVRVCVRVCVCVCVCVVFRSGWTDVALGAPPRSQPRFCATVASQPRFHHLLLGITPLLQGRWGPSWAAPLGSSFTAPTLPDAPCTLPC